MSNEIMTTPTAGTTPGSFDQPLTRRHALSRTGAALAAFGAAATGARPTPLLAQEASPPADEPGPADAPGAVSAARAALAVARLPELAEEVMRRSGVPGMAVAVVYDDTVLYSGGFGVREVGKDAPVDADTVFQLASVSKPVAATVVSAVVGDGEISWQSRMADLVPWFALPDAWPTQNVTLADLFAHRSGLRDHAGDVLEDIGYDRMEVIHRLRYLEPRYSFRAGYAYGNFGLTAAAEAVAQAAGNSWEDLSAERLYVPLGMTQTSSRFADYIAAPNRAVAHVKEGDAWVVTPTQRNPDAQTPAGGASSTANDLAKWLRLQLGQGSFNGEQLIPAAALAPMHRPQVVTREPADPARQRAGFYGLGIIVNVNDNGAVQWGHSGAFASGAATTVYMLPASGFGVLVLCNAAPDGTAETLALSLLDLAATGEISRDWQALLTAFFVGEAEDAKYSTVEDWDALPTDAMPALADAAYLGAYQNEYYGEVEIASGADGLVMRIGPQPMEFPLLPWDRDTFSWQPPGENAIGRSGLSFLIGPDDTAIALRDEYLAKFGPGLLTRTR